MPHRLWPTVRRIQGYALLLVATLALVTLADAHPGRTDSRGGHTCRTNCPDWGLNYGEYHYHGGSGGSGGSGQYTPPPPPPPQAPPSAPPVAVLDYHFESRFEVHFSADRSTFGSNPRFQWRVTSPDYPTTSTDSFRWIHKLPGPGHFHVKLTVADDSGQWNESATDLAVLPPFAFNTAPAASFVATARGASLTLNATATTDADGDPLTFTWRINSSIVGSGTVLILYPQWSGTRDIELVISDGSTTQALVQRVEFPRPSEPYVAIHGHTQVNAKQTAVLLIEAWEYDGTVTNVTWTTADGKHFGDTLTFVPPSAGTYEVAVQVSTSLNRTASRFITMVAQEPPPQVQPAWTVRPTQTPTQGPVVEPGASGLPAVEYALSLVILLVALIHSRRQYRQG